MTATDKLNVLLANATREQITAAYRLLTGMDDPNGLGKYKQYGIYQSHTNISLSEKAIQFWLHTEADKIETGLFVFAQHRGPSAKNYAKFVEIENRAVAALESCGVSAEIWKSQDDADAAFAACGGSVRVY